MAMSKSTNTNQLLINPTILSKAIEMNKRGMRKQYPTLFLFKKIKDDATIRELTNFGVVQPTISYYELSLFIF